MVISALVRDGVIVGPMKLDIRHMLSTRRANCLYSRIRINTFAVSIRMVRVERSRISGERGDPRAEDRIAGQDIGETSSIAVADSPDTTGVNAKAILQMIDEIIEEVQVVDIREGSILGGAVARVGHEA